MFLIDTYLGKSKIHGVGVFSKQNVKKGRKIKEVRPEFEIRFNKTNLPRMPLALANFIQTHAHEEDENEYCLGIDNEKYLNHSDNPTVDEKVYALKNIKIGDEITIDYNNFDDSIKAWLT